MQEHQLIDRYKRHLNYLRISITDRCNLRCIYCNPRLPRQKLRHKEVLRYEEILRIARIGVSMGITKIRVTGGEPLARKGCCEFLENLSTIDGLKDISLTTNGVLLKQHIDRIAAAGVKRLNISLDTLNPEKYQRITGHDVFKQVWEGIEERLLSKPAMKPAVLKLIERVNYGQQLDIDDHGRIVVPALLREMVDVEGEAVISGRINHLAITRRERAAAILKDLSLSDEELEELAQLEL